MLPIIINYRIPKYFIITTARIIATIVYNIYIYLLGALPVSLSHGYFENTDLKTSPIVLLYANMALSLYFLLVLIVISVPALLPLNYSTIIIGSPLLMPLTLLVITRACSGTIAVIAITSPMASTILIGWRRALPLSAKYI